MPIDPNYPPYPIMGDDTKDFKKICQNCGEERGWHQTVHTKVGSDEYIVLCLKDPKNKVHLGNNIFAIGETFQLTTCRELHCPCQIPEKRCQIHFGDHSERGLR
jgi:hypothetical protein